MDRSTICYRRNVEREIPLTVRIIQFSLYACVLIFTIIGSMYGFLWGVLAVATLFGSWYYMGMARVNYEYHLDGHTFSVIRHSGMRSKPKHQEFLTCSFDDLIAAGTDMRPELEEAENMTAKAQPKRITCDVSAHRTDGPCAVMYVMGGGADAGHWLKIYFEPDGELKEHLSMICGKEKVHFDELN